MHHNNDNNVIFSHASNSYVPKDNNSQLIRNWCSKSICQVFYPEMFMLEHPSSKRFLLEKSNAHNFHSHSTEYQKLTGESILETQKKDVLLLTKILKTASAGIVHRNVTQKRLKRIALLARKTFVLVKNKEKDGGSSDEIKKF